MSSPASVIIIPARMSSKRFPGKPLVKIAGRELLSWTYERALQTGCRVEVAAGDAEIASYCERTGMAFVLVDDPCRNGTQRCALAAARLGLGDETVVVNWQVDEPLVDPKSVLKIVEHTGRLRCARIYTLYSDLAPGDAADDNAVKTVVVRGDCQWFSRAPMAGAFLHVGVYVMWLPLLRRSLLESDPAKHERLERLEQLGWLENLYIIRAFKTGWAPSVNTPADVQRVEMHLRAMEAAR